MASWRFTTPFVSEGPASWGTPLLMRYRLRRGVSILLESGTYRQARYPTQDEVREAEAAYIGGYEYTVNDATKAALIAAGVGVTEDNFTAPVGSYGAGGYGEGPYGG